MLSDRLRYRVEKRQGTGKVSELKLCMSIIRYELLEDLWYHYQEIPTSFLTLRETIDPPTTGLETGHPRASHACYAGSE